MNYSLVLAGLAWGFFVLLLIAMQIGKWLGAGMDGKGGSGTPIVEGSVFAVFGLSVAVTFSGGPSAWRTVAIFWSRKSMR
ncbi:hypothetical protein [Achromobacter insolitus]|uniref:hypothetical protein n=1 Tax=Achromobacter insolitus TaxID=217204 RepID=UPI001749AA59|nr:hypothetical protein [Achromobacter insolitus]